MTTDRKQLLIQIASAVALFIACTAITLLLWALLIPQDWRKS